MIEKEWESLGAYSEESKQAIRNFIEYFKESIKEPLEELKVLYNRKNDELSKTFKIEDRLCLFDEIMLLNTFVHIDDYLNSPELNEAISERVRKKYEREEQICLETELNDNKRES